MTMQSSYWETHRELFTTDLLVVGSGFTGLCAGRFARDTSQSMRIAVVDQQRYGQSLASTRNAGFACFGSPTEILYDINHEGAEQAFSRVQRRYEGIQMWLDMFPGQDFEYSADGGLEVFQEDERHIYENALDHLSLLNQEFRRHINRQEVFSEGKGISQALPLAINIAGEAGLHPGKLHSCLMENVRNEGIQIISGISIPPPSEWIKEKGLWHIPTASGLILAEYVLLSNNAGLSELDDDTVPGRGQVILTEPFNHGLPSGTYHAREGYMYFRTLGKRILLGGGRDAFREQEESLIPLGTEDVKQYLQNYLTTHICPGQVVSLDQHWAGVMAFSKRHGKSLLVKNIDEKVLTVGRMGGMGVAIAPKAAQDAIHQLLS